jgi:hypothetical protein
MGNGLKDQWGVGEPAKAGSDKQAQQFQASFQKEITGINGHLQYTSANAEAARHGPLASRRDALYPAFQSALARDRSDEPVEGAGRYRQSASGREGAERRSREISEGSGEGPLRLAIAPAQVRHGGSSGRRAGDMGDAKATALRGLVDGIRTQTNERRYAQGCTTLDQLLPKLKPIFDDYQKQKAAKPKYEQALAEQSARLDALKAAERPSLPMTVKASEADTALQAARAKADSKDFVGACDQMKTVQSAVDALDKLAKDPQRGKFLADRKSIEEIINAPGDTSFKSLEADWNAILQLREQSDPVADAGDYAGANKMLADLKAKVAAYKTKLEELKKARDAYQAIADRVEAQMQEVSTSTFPALESKKAELTAAYQKMTGLATAEDFKGAEAAAKALETSIKAFLTERDKQREQIKSRIKSNLPAIESDMKGLSAAKSPSRTRSTG